MHKEASEDLFSFRAEYLQNLLCTDKMSTHLIIDDNGLMSVLPLLDQQNNARLNLSEILFSRHHQSHHTQLHLKIPNGYPKLLTRISMIKVLPPLTNVF